MLNRWMLMPVAVAIAMVAMTGLPALAAPAANGQDSVTPNQTKAPDTSAAADLQSHGILKTITDEEDPRYSKPDSRSKTCVPRVRGPVSQMMWQMV